MTKQRRMLGMVMIAALALSGCNTIAGIGRDVESIGETVEDAAT